MMAQGRGRSINSMGFGGVVVLESFCEEVYLYAHVFFIIAVLYHKICGDLEFPEMISIIASNLESEVKYRQGFA